MRRLDVTTTRVAALCAVAALSVGAAPAAEGRLTGAASPHEAVRELAARVIGEDYPLVVGAEAFDGLPHPQSGVAFAARSLGVDEAGFRLSVSVEARTERGVIARRNFVFPWRVNELVVVPKRLIRAGSMIRSEDLEVKVLSLEGGRERHTVTLDGLVGRVAQRTLLAGRPVPSRMVERPAVVERGAPVKVRMYVGTMEISMEGEALEDGAVGKMVKVLNPSSKKVLSGRVVDHGLIEVKR